MLGMSLPNKIYADSDAGQKQKITLNPISRIESSVTLSLLYKKDEGEIACKKEKRTRKGSGAFCVQVQPVGVPQVAISEP